MQNRKSKMQKGEINSWELTSLNAVAWMAALVSIPAFLLGVNPRLKGEAVYASSAHQIVAVADPSERLLRLNGSEGSASENQSIQTKLSAVDHDQRLRDLRSWAGKNYHAAMTWANTLPDLDERCEALEAVCYGLAQTNPARAVELAASLQMGDRPGTTLENLVQQWAALDVSAALTWARMQPIGERRNEYLSRVALVMSQTDPPGAARLVVGDLSPGTAKNEAVIMVLHRWLLHDYDGAANWVALFPAGPLRERAIVELSGFREDLGI